MALLCRLKKYDAGIEAKLKYTDKNNNTKEVDLTTSYRYPHQKVPDEWEVFNLGQYIEQLTEAEQIEPDQSDKKPDTEQYIDTSSRKV